MIFFERDEDTSEELDKILDETLDDIRRTDQSLEFSDKNLEKIEDTQKILEHTDEMLGRIVGIYKAREYRRKHGDIAYRRKYHGDTSVKTEFSGYTCGGNDFYRGYQH